MSAKPVQIDATISVVTPENIAFQYQVAGPFRRLPAFIIDLTIRIAAFAGMVMLLFIVIAYLGQIFQFTSGNVLFEYFAGVAVFAFLFLWFVFEWFYGGLFEGLWGGRTPGKWILGLRVVTVDGEPINLLQGLLRNILRTADMLPAIPLPYVMGLSEAEFPPIFAVPTFAIGLIVMMNTPRFQRLGDLVCHTQVIVEQRNWLLRIAPIEDKRAAQLAEYIPAGFIVNRRVAQALATYVERRKLFSSARRREIAAHLAEPLLARFGLPADTSYDLLLCALYHRTFLANAESAKASGPPAPVPQAPAQPVHEVISIRV